MGIDVDIGVGVDVGSSCHHSPSDEVNACVGVNANLMFADAEDKREAKAARPCDLAWLSSATMGASQRCWYSEGCP